MILGVLLAAGASRRMGSDKLGLPWRGSTVLAATLERWQAVPELDEILLVRRREEPAESLGKLGTGSRLRVVVNPHADEGMGSSLRVAAQALPPRAEAVVVGLADMPEVASASIASLVAAWRPRGPRGIVAPAWRGRRGHPVVFGAEHFPALRALAGDHGARAVLEERAADLTLVALDDPGVLLDLDAPGDLERRP